MKHLASNKQTIYVYTSKLVKPLLSPLGKDEGKLNPLIPIKGALFSVWLKMAQRFWRNRVYCVVDVFLLFRDFFPLEKDVHGSLFE